jgi:two-component system OmpR family response regulator
MHILVSGSDSVHCKFLSQSFQAEHYEVAVTSDAEVWKSLKQDHYYDAAILDITPPGSKGLEVLQSVRAHGQRLPIIVLASHNQHEEIIRILELGASDFVLKPYIFSELSTRLQALLHAKGSPSQAVLRVQDLELDQVARKVTRAGRVIELTPKEFSLLDYLIRNAGHHVTRAQIFERVWNSPYNTPTNIVDVYINYVRKKVDAQAERKLIHTVRGVGYQLQV